MKKSLRACVLRKIYAFWRPIRIGMQIRVICMLMRLYTWCVQLLFILVFC